MRAWLLALGWLAAAPGPAPAAPAPKGLRRAGETVLFSFVTRRGKRALLCEGALGRYLVYRFGTAAHTELQYPAVLDAGSWRKFAYEEYHRGGGAHNAGRDTHRLFFRAGHTTYALLDETADLYDKQYGETERRTVGITVYGRRQTTFMEGRESSAHWQLQLTEEQRRKVPQYVGQY